MNALATYLSDTDQTKRSFAKLIGISPSYLSDLLRDHGRKPSLEMAFKIERCTGGEVPASSWVTRSDAESGASEGAS